MEDKFKKYFETMPFLFYLATVMDPRVKIENLKLLLANFSTCLNYEHDVDKLLLEIRTTLEEMYTLYRNEIFPAATEPSTPTPTQASSTSLGKRIASFKSILSSSTRKKHSSGAGSFDELNLYLNTSEAEINENDN